MIQKRIILLNEELSIERKFKEIKERKYDNIHTYDNSWVYDEINFDETPVDTTRIKNIGPLKIVIYNGEGKNIPHFHLKNKDESFMTCICLHTNKYFIHGQNTDKLNSSQCKRLDKYLNEKSKVEPSKTNWEVLCQEWNMNFIPKYKYKFAEKPDYTKMKESITER